MMWQNINKTPDGYGGLSSGLGESWGNSSDRPCEFSTNTAMTVEPSSGCMIPASPDYASTGGLTASVAGGNSSCSSWTKPSSVRTWQPDTEALGEAIELSLSFQPWQIDSLPRLMPRRWFWQRTTGSPDGSILALELIAKVGRIKAPLLAGCICLLWICKVLLDNSPGIAMSTKLPKPALSPWQIEIPKHLWVKPIGK